MGGYIALVLAVALPAGVAAQATGTVQTPTAASQATPSQTTPSRLTQIDAARASRWGLSETEWQRYRELMQGMRASVSPPTISPIEVLGIHARNPAERRRFAERWARAMHEDVERILAFQRAYQQAYRLLYPNEMLIDPERLVRPVQKPTPLQSTDRVMFFTRVDCPPCDALLERVLRHQDQVAGIDLYIAGLDAGDDAGVRAFARKRSIDPARVHARRITLNHEGGKLDELTRGRGSIPYILRARGEALTPLVASQL